MALARGWAAPRAPFREGQTVSGETDRCRPSSAVAVGRLTSSPWVLVENLLLCKSRGRTRFNIRLELGVI